MRAKTIVTASLLACTLCHSYEQTTATETTNLQADIHKLAKDTDDTNIAGFIVVPKEITLEKNGNMVENQEIPLHYYPMSENDSDVTISSTSHVVKLQNQANPAEESVSLSIFNNDNQKLTDANKVLATLTSSNNTGKFALQTRIDAFPSEEIYTGTMTFASEVQVVTDITWQIAGASELKPASTATYQLIPHPATSRSTPETVTWSVENKNSEETKIDEKTGELTIGLDENEGTLTITATPEDGESYTKEVTVKPLLKGDDFTYDGIEWTVMKREATQALIVTKDVVGGGFKYNKIAEATNDYAESQLKTYAGNFYEQLSNMKSYVLPVMITEGFSKEATTVDDSGTKQVFALSSEDITANWTSEVDRIANKNWWLRTKDKSNTANYINTNGELKSQSTNIGNDAYLRPALYIKQGTKQEVLELKHSHEEDRAKPTDTVQYILYKDGQEVSHEQVIYSIHDASTPSDKTDITDDGKLKIGLNEQSDKIIVQATHNGQTVEKHVGVLPLKEGDVINIDGLDWRVLKIDEDAQQALLITEYVQGDKGIVFNEEGNGNIYQGSNLEAQMHEFYTNVSDTIKHHALPVNLPIDSERAHGDEVSNQTSVASEGEPTAFALSGADKMSIFGENYTEAIAYVDDEAKEKEDAKHWWLRTKAKNGDSPAAYIVNPQGYNSVMTVQGENSVTPYLRPAVYVHLGSETYEPWTITGQDAVIKGDKKVAYHMVSNELNPTDIDLTWDVYYAKSAETKIDENGELAVAEDETATTITVVATNGKQTARKDIRVEPPVEITKATVTDANNPQTDINIFDIKEAIQGETIQFESNFIGELEEDIQWRVTGAENNDTTISDKGLLKVAEGETATKLTIMATSQYNPDNYAEFDLTVTPKLKFTSTWTSNLEVFSSRSYRTNIDAEFSLPEDRKDYLIIEDSNKERKILVKSKALKLVKENNNSFDLTATSKTGNRTQEVTETITIDPPTRTITLGGIDWNIFKTSQNNDGTTNYFMIMNKKPNDSGSWQGKFGDSTDYKSSTLNEVLKNQTVGILGQINQDPLISEDAQATIQPVNVSAQGESDITEVSAVTAGGQATLFALTRKDYENNDLGKFTSGNQWGWWLRTKKEGTDNIYYIDYDEVDHIGVGQGKDYRAGIVLNFGY